MYMNQISRQFVTVRTEIYFLLGLKMDHWLDGILKRGKRNLSFMIKILLVEI